MKWQPGQSGNPKGRPRKRLFDEYLQERITSRRGATARALVERLIGEAIKGNIPALKLIAERIGGKPKSAEEIAGSKSGEAMTLDEVRRRLAQLLAMPEVRRSLEVMLSDSKPPQTDKLQ